VDSHLAWKPSRFNMVSRRSDGTLLVYNSFSGALVQVNGTEADHVATTLAGRSLVEPKGVLSVLALQGLLVPSTVDELEKTRRLHDSLFEQHDRLHLTLMPTEKCNFRCAYCYEDFSRGKMSTEVIDSVIHLVQQQAAKLRILSILWFGGEPLTALDIVEEVSHRVVAICRENQIQYSAGMTTNGYLLAEQGLERCLSAEISQFQITLDGPAETHDTLRVLADGSGTFDAILGNMCSMRDREEDFHVRIRVNFTPATIPHIPEFLTFMGSEFGSDPRFSIYFRPVGEWGGEQNHFFRTCDQGTADSHGIHFMSMAFQEGLGLDAWKESMHPFGSVCYAADPRSFVIGSDGTVYKCTVAFDDPRNQIGRITSDGSLSIDEQLHDLWTLSWEETDPECQKCAFFPACQGNMCPLRRLNGAEKRCPAIKTHLKECLPLLATEATASTEGEHSDVR
jgi:uncharacterized protein